MNDLEKLKQLTNEIDPILAKRIDPSSEEFISWRTKVERVLGRIYGEDSKECKGFKNRPFWATALRGSMDTNAENRKACHEGLQATRAKLKVYIEELDELDELDDTEESVGKDIVRDYTKVFIVHGHDGELKEKVARLLEHQKIGAVILHEQPNRGRTIIEKIEAYSKGVDAAICLYTSDDEMMDGSKRARQNVVFETGYFCGTIGRENTIIIAESEALNLSDLDGVVYVDKNNWEVDVLKELRDIGYQIDMNKL